MENVRFVKLKEVQEFQILKDKGFSFKKWDEATRKMLVSEKWQDGYSKRFGFETDKGILEVSQAQIGQMLAGIFNGGVANVLNKRFSVKTNGQTGMEIRYFINPIFEKVWFDGEPVEETKPVKQDVEGQDLDDLPF